MEPLLVDLAFKGKYYAIDLLFLDIFFSDARQIKFIYPNEIDFNSINELIEVIKSNSYVDLIITTDAFKVNDKLVKKVFINLGKDEDNLDLLLFFDVKDLCYLNSKEALEALRVWACQFVEKYKFEYMACRMDNGNDDEYYFDRLGFGPLYYAL